MKKDNKKKRQSKYRRHNYTNERKQENIFIYVQKRKQERRET